MPFWTEHPKWVQNPKFTAPPLLSFGSLPPPPRGGDRITLDRQEFLHMVLFSSSKCNVSRSGKTSVYDRKKLASIKIVHKGVKSEFWKSIIFFVKEAAWLLQEDWVPQKKGQRQSVFSSCIVSIFQDGGRKKQKCNLGRCALFTLVNTLPFSRIIK